MTIRNGNRDRKTKLGQSVEDMAARTECPEWDKYVEQDNYGAVDSQDMETKMRTQRRRG